MCSILATFGLILSVTACSRAILPTWNMHHVCGQTISQRDKGGFLVFDSHLLPAGYQWDCRVVIHPARIGSTITENHVAFHFSNFEVGKYCKDTNLTVYDGSGVTTKLIEGLKTPMCGANSSLTKDVTFTTHEDYMTVVFRRDRTALNLQSKFNMTFLAFADGACKIVNSAQYSCNATNKRCISSDFVCENLNPCGDNSDCPWPTFGEFIVNIAAVIVPIVIFLIFVGVCCGIMQGVRKRKSGCLGELCSEMRRLIRDLCGLFNRQQTDENETHTGLFSECRSSQYDPVPEPSTATPSADESSSARGHGWTSESQGTVLDPARHNQDYNTFSKEQEASASSHSTRLSPSAPNVPTAPPVEPEVVAPPSYDEVLANESLYGKRD